MCEQRHKKICFVLAKHGRMCLITFMSLNRHLCEYLTIREVSEIVGLSKRQVRRLTEPGAPLEAARRAPVLIDPARVEAFAAARKQGKK